MQQFTDVSDRSGISFANTITESPEQNIFSYEYMYNGAGVAVGDVNNDGLPDVFFTGNQLPDQLYLNKGNFQFEDITAASDVAGKPGWKTGVSMADVNSDGLLDIYVSYSGRADMERSNQLFINKGLKDGTPYFIDEAAAYGLDAPNTNSNQSLFFDYDRDGDLDMFLLNHAVVFYSPLVNTYKLRHKRHPWYSNFLYRNDNGHFTDVSAEAGIAGGGNNFGLGVVASDINNDGWPDLYMTNDYEEQDFLLLNNHDGTFKEVTKQSLSHISKYGMGCDVADYNNDGFMDIMVPDMWPEDNFRQKVLRGPDEYDKYNILVDSGYMHQNMRNTLQLNRGIDKTGLPLFSEIGQLAGISSTDWSWSSLLADFDNDGNKDLYITNGFWRDFSNMDFQTYQVASYMQTNGPRAPLYHFIDSMPQTKLSNYYFHNNGDLGFENQTTLSGLQTSNVSHGAAYADFDNDGDLDLVVNNMGERASLYRNNNISKGNYLKIKLVGNKGNSFAVGSRITVTTATGFIKTAEQQPVRGYLSSMEPVVHIGVGKDSLLASVVVNWPDGKTSVLQNVTANQVLTIDAKSAIEGKASQPLLPGAFTDISSQSGIDFYAKENPWVDFKEESLLPWQLSRQGPKMCKGDVNGDQLEDIFIGAPHAGKSILYLQSSNGNFTKSVSQPWQNHNNEIIQSLFFDADADKDMDLYLVSGGNEITDAATLQDHLFLNDGKGRFALSPGALPPMFVSKSCVAAGDFNSDGKPDLFVGGRVVPGKYGITPRSFLLQNATVNGEVKFVDVTKDIAPGVSNAGMVTAAVWSDINKDGQQDLLVAGEWMPVKAFLNLKNRLSDESESLGLHQSDGLWTMIKSIDIDQDGDDDFMLGNLAPNTTFKASAKEPLTLCVNDFFGNGKISQVLCQFNNGKSYPYASRNEISEDMPLLKKKFFYYKDYAQAGINDIFTAAQLEGMQELKAYQLQNCWLENKKGKLVLHTLPTMAQFAPIQSMVTTDINADGKKEMFVVGNFFPFRVQLGREDAGKGLLLQWDKVSGKVIVSPVQPNVMVDGDVRDALAINLSNKEQIIVVSKNAEPLQVLKSNAVITKQDSRLSAVSNKR